MSYSNGEIYGVVSINDIQRALGVSANDLGTLCRHANINKWARFKPVIYSNKFAFRSRVISTFHLPFTPDPDFDAKTGLNISQLASFEDPIDIADYDSYVEVTYNKPSGGNNSPFRDTDWCEYYHNAQPPMTIEWDSRFAVDKAIGCTCYIQTEQSEFQSIQFSNIMNELVTLHGFDAYKTYLCIAVMDDGGQPFWFFFSDDTYGAGKREWHVQTRNMYDFQRAISSMVGDTFYFVVFLVNDTNDNIDSDITDKYGISATDMNSIKSQFKVCALSFDEAGGTYHDRTSAICRSSSAYPSEDFVYTLDTAFLAQSEGYYTYNYHDVLVIDITLGDFSIEISKSIFGDVEGGQFRTKMSIGNNNLAYSYNDGTTDRYEVDWQNPTTRQTYAVSAWVNIRDLSKNDMGTKWKLYYFPADDAYVFYSLLLFNAFNVPSNLQSINLYYDLANGDTGIENIYFDIYFRASPSSQEQRVYGVTIPYNIAIGHGETPLPNS